MVKIVQSGNLNLCPHYYFLDKEKLHARQDDFLKNFSLSVDGAIEEKADFYVINGNFFDVPCPAPQQLSKVIKQFDRLAASECGVIIASGPHDVSKDDTMFSGDAVAESENVHVFRDSADYTPYAVKKHGMNIVFWGKKYSHKERSACPDIQGLKEDDFNVLLHCGKTTGDEVRKLTGEAFDYISIVGPHEEDLDFGKLLVASPGLEKRSFDEVDEEKGFHLIELNDKKVTCIEFKPVTCRCMEVIKINLTLSTSSIVKEFKNKITHGRKEGIVKLVLKGKVLFEMYKNYNRLEVEEILENRFFFHVIENVIQIEDLEAETFDDIRIFSVEDEYALLLDQKIDSYEKKKNSEYCTFYQNVRQLGLKFLTQSELGRDQS
jgi:DNA repair exonuclease SbcCD nuclease subunit